jgi:hypothetical protein
MDWEWFWRGFLQGSIQEYTIEGSRRRSQGTRLRWKVGDARCRMHDPGCRVQGAGCRNYISNFELRIADMGKHRAQGMEHGAESQSRNDGMVE